MTLLPLLNAPLIVQLHVAAALAALVLGPMAILRRSRDIWHRRLGRIWVAAMATTALSSLAIHEARQIGPFSVIHLLSVFTLWQLWQAVRHARAGRIAAHRGAMLGLYVYAIGVAGLFTLLPGRRMSLALFPGAPWAGFAMLATVLAAGLVWMQLAQRRARG